MLENLLLKITKLNIGAPVFTLLDRWQPELHESIKKEIEK